MEICQFFLDKERFPASGLKGLRESPIPERPWVCVVLSWGVAASRPNKLKNTSPLFSDTSWN